MEPLQHTTSLLVAVFGTYGIATLLSDYNGPFRAFQRLRHSKMGELFECNVCLSPYIALAFALGLGLGLWEYLAVVGACVVLARLT